MRGKYFEYLLTRFSEPNEVFGPIDLVRLREGTVATVTTGMLPEAEFIFLDELFNANSAILNNLLTVLNERIYRRGAEVHRLPLALALRGFEPPARRRFAASLVRPVLAALPCREPQARRTAAAARGRLGAGAVRARSSRRFRRKTCGPFRGGSTKLTFKGSPIDMPAWSRKVRDLGVALSDRRVVKILKLVAASAVLCGRKAAGVSDFWVFRYVWDREEQIAPLAALVAGVIEPHAGEPDAHPLAAAPDRVDGEEIARQLDAIALEMQDTIARPGRHGEAARAAGRAVGPGGLAGRGRAAQAPDWAGCANC